MGPFLVSSGVRLPVAGALLVVALGVSGCDGTTLSTPVAPSPPITAPPPAPPPVVISGTFQVRSGNEGLPALPGATVRVAGRDMQTDSAGRVVVDAITAGDEFTVEAPRHYAFAGVLSAANPARVVTLRPIEDGVFDWFWVTLTSYYGPDYDDALWRPIADVNLSLEGELQEAPSRATWEQAVALIADASVSGDPAAPRVRLVAEGGVPVRVVPGADCSAQRWLVQNYVLAPPPAITFRSADQARDPQLVLAVVAELVGYHLEIGRRMFAAGSALSLSAAERMGLRMRMLREPGTRFDRVTEREAPAPLFGALAWSAACR